MSDLDHLAKSTTFGGFRRELLEKMVSWGEKRHLADGEMVFRAGQEYRNEIYVLLQGEVVVQRPDGSSYMVPEGEFLGLGSFLDHLPYSSTAAARGGAKLLVLSMDLFMSLKEEYPELSRAVNRTIADRIRRWSPTRRATSGVLVRPVRSVMMVPLGSCPPQTSLAEAFSLMKSRNMGSLGVIGGNGRLLGLVTSAVLAEAVLVRGLDSRRPVTDLDLLPPLTVSADAPLWQVEQMQEDHQTKYVVVMEDGAPVGMVSQTDIVRSLCLHAQQHILMNQAEEASSLSELAGLFGRMEECASEALEYNRRASNAIRVISETHLALHRRCVELTLEEMENEGFGSAPTPYALLIMGSGGRREMMLDPDQDNGIILADLPEEGAGKVRPWFKDFSERLNRNLARIGYALCPGEIMARNPMFHKTLGEWKAQISHMARYPNEKAARWSNVVFDFATLFGEDQLTLELRKHVHRELGTKHRLLNYMMQDDAEGQPPIGWFNRLITTTGRSKGKIDMKRNGLRIIADAARIYSLSTGIATCNTLDRINALVRQGVLEPDFADSASSAYEELIAMVLDHQIAQRRQGKSLDKLIDPDSLTPHQRETLRDAMLAVKRFQEKLQGEFALMPF